MDTEVGFRRKCRRYNTPGHAHFLTFSCYKQQAFLSKDRIRHYLAEALLKAKGKYHFDIWAYVFMPEHVHFLLWPWEETYSISSVLHSIKQSVSRRAVIYLRKHNPTGLEFLATGQKDRPYRFCQDGGGHDRNVISPKAIRATIEYIHNNPVRRGLVQYPTQWPWSSASDWLEQLEGPVPIDKHSVPML